MGDNRKLGHRAAGVHFSGAGEPPRLTNVYCYSVEDPAGVHHLGGLYSNCLLAVWRNAKVEQHGLLRSHRRRCLLRS